MRSAGFYQLLNIHPILSIGTLTQTRWQITQACQTHDGMKQNPKVQILFEFKSVTSVVGTTMMVWIFIPSVKKRNVLFEVNVSKLNYHTYFPTICLPPENTCSADYCIQNCVAQQSQNA